MKDVIVKTFLSAGVALVMAGAVSVGAGALDADVPQRTVETQTVDAGAKGYGKADEVRLVMRNFDTDESVKSLNIYLTSTNGKKLMEWSKEEDLKQEKEYQIFDNGGVNYSYFHGYFSDEDLNNADSVKAKFVVNGKTFNKKIPLSGKPNKSFKSGSKTVYSYGDAMKWKISSTGVSN